MNFNLAKNVFRCNYGGQSSGTIELYAKVHEISNSPAYREICEILYGKKSQREYETITRHKEKTKLPANSEIA